MNGNFHLMALTGIGSLKHHVLSTKRAGFIFIFIVQTIKSGADVKQHPFDIMKPEDNIRLDARNHVGLALWNAPLAVRVLRSSSGLNAYGLSCLDFTD